MGCLQYEITAGPYRASKSWEVHSAVESVYVCRSANTACLSAQQQSTICTCHRYLLGLTDTAVEMTFPKRLLKACNHACFGSYDRGAQVLLCSDCHLHLPLGDLSPINPMPTQAEEMSSLVTAKTSDSGPQARPNLVFCTLHVHWPVAFQGQTSASLTSRQFSYIQVTTLKRNGSDYSATIVGALFQASQITIWTDVDGIYSADPRKVPEAVCLPSLSYHEAWELSYFGANVLHPRTTLPAMRYSIPITIRNFFNLAAPGKLQGCAI